MDANELKTLRSLLDKAAEDLESAASLSSAGPACMGTALSHCQLATEESVKAYLAYSGTFFGQGCDVLTLLDLASDTTSAFEPLRYEDELTPPSSFEQLALALSDAREFFRVTLSLLPAEVSSEFAV